MELTKKTLKGHNKNELIKIILLQQEMIKKQGEKTKALEARIAQLEKNSETSSKPPSSDHNKPSRNQSLRKKSGRRPGGQKGHPGKTREHENPDETIQCEPNRDCSNCGSRLDKTQSECVAVRQEVEKHR